MINLGDRVFHLTHAFYDFYEPSFNAPLDSSTYDSDDAPAKDFSQANVLSVDGQLIQDSQDITCSICLQDMTPEQTLLLIEPCSHAYHHDCLKQWYTRKN
jgi:hypothetical protein